jgi:hypothetical protein
VARTLLLALVPTWGLAPPLTPTLTLGLAEELAAFKLPTKLIPYGT